MTKAPQNRFASPYFALAFIALACAIPATAQRRPGGTATRAFGIEAFGGYTFLSTADGNGGNGLFLGADLTRSLRHFDLAAEARYTRGSGDTVTEQSVLGGAKIAKRFGRLHPYATALVGYGAITFLHPIVFATGPYSHDNSFVFDVGGGLDYDLSHGFALKADCQYQRWNLGTQSLQLTPVASSIGIVYRFPAGPLKNLPQ